MLILLLMVRMPQTYGTPPPEAFVPGGANASGGGVSVHVGTVCP